MTDAEDACLNSNMVEVVSAVWCGVVRCGRGRGRGLTI
jgi:hypothetical protein